MAKRDASVPGVEEALKRARLDGEGEVEMKVAVDDPWADAETKMEAELEEARAELKEARKMFLTATNDTIERVEKYVASAKEEVVRLEMRLDALRKDRAAALLAQQQQARVNQTLATIHENLQQLSLKQEEGMQQLSLKQEEGMSRLQQDIAEIKSPKMPSVSASELGSTVLNDLGENFKVVPVGEGEPVIEEEALESIRQHVDEASSKKEATFNALVFEHLSAALPEGAVLVNSEEHAWLHHNDMMRRFRKKPDFFVAAHNVYEKKDPPNTENKELADLYEKENFGVGGKYFCDYTVCVVETKLQANNAAVGELVEYLQHLGYKKPYQYQHVGLLIDLNEIQMFAARREQVIRGQKCKWTNPGSRQVVRDFIALGMGSEPVKQLTAAASRHKVKVTGILGASLSRVFSCERDGAHDGEEEKQGELLALKVTPSELNEALASEIAALNEAARVEGAPVARMLSDMFKDEESGCCSYLLGPCGTPLSVHDVKDDSVCEKVVASLQKLHEKGVIHGDARWPNVVRVQPDEYVWIDLRIGVNYSEADDARKLIESLIKYRRGGARENVQLSDDVSRCIGEYATGMKCLLDVWRGCKNMNE